MDKSTTGAALFVLEGNRWKSSPGSDSHRGGIRKAFSLDAANRAPHSGIVVLPCATAVAKPKLSKPLMTVPTAVSRAM
jgi:hypothetical protein